MDRLSASLQLPPPPRRRVGELHSGSAVPVDVHRTVRKQQLYHCGHALSVSPSARSSTLYLAARIAALGSPTRLHQPRWHADDVGLSAVLVSFLAMSHIPYEGHQGMMAHETTWDGL